MKSRTSIRRVLPQHFVAGICFVCEQPAILKWKDAELHPTLGFIGDCCRGAVIQADKCLAGFAHPPKQREVA